MPRSPPEIRYERFEEASTSLDAGVGAGIESPCLTPANMDVRTGGYLVPRARTSAEDLLIPFAEAMAVVFKRRRRHRWVTEAGMAIDVWGAAHGDIVLGSLYAIVKALVRDLAPRWRGWGSVIGNRAGVRTSGQRQGQQQRRANKQSLSHTNSSSKSIEGLLARRATPPRKPALAANVARAAGIRNA
jgi:hypothetical protein